MKNRTLLLVDDEPELLSVLSEQLGSRFGDVIDELPPSMGAEDFALFSDAVPGFRFHIGSGQPGRSDRVHAPDYQPDEGSIRLGVEACCGILLELLARA